MERRARDSPWADGQGVARGVCDGNTRLCARAQRRKRARQTVGGRATVAAGRAHGPAARDDAVSERTVLPREQLEQIQRAVRSAASSELELVIFLQLFLQPYRTALTGILTTAKPWRKKAPRRSFFFWHLLVLPKHPTRTDHGTAVGVRGFVRSQRGAREAHARGAAWHAPPSAGARWPAEDAATRIAAPGGESGCDRHPLLNPG